jgi:hypothetical protein|tara:strand:+ start:3932 stop:5422 length:1491 start_codon:yes stop_codon:yes gene_type:complete
MPSLPGFVGGSYEAQAPLADVERTVNFYVEILQSQGATVKTALFPSPGAETFATAVGAVGGRAMFAGNTTSAHVATNAGRAFAVIGSIFFEINAQGAPTNRGTVAVDTNPATISTSGDQGGELFITSGDRGYNYDLGTDTLTEVLASGATQGGFLNGRFIAFDRTAGSFRISDLFDGLTWDATQTAQRTVGSDPWRAMHVTPYGYLALLGTESSEFWFDSGAFPFPFVPDPSGHIPYGIAATFSVKQVGDYMVWVSSQSEGGFQVVRAAGFSPQKISTTPIDRALEGYSRIDDAEAETYSEDGHAFYLLTLPTADKTWCCDMGSVGRVNPWTERMTWDETTGAEHAWRLNFHCFAFGRRLFSDRASGVIYSVGNTLPSDVDGKVIRRLRRAPALVNENKLIRYAWFELLMGTGLGVVTGQGSDPLVWMRMSNDAGQTWGSALNAGAGAIGQFDQRVFWTPLGTARQRVFEVEVSDPINNWRLLDAFVRVQPSTEAA